MKLGITQYSFHRAMGEGRMDYRGFVKKAAELGCRTVDIVGYWWKDEEKESREIRKWCKEAKVELAAYAVRDDLVKRVESEQDAQVEQIRRGIATAKRMGAPSVRIFGGHVPEGYTDEECLSLVVKGLRKVVGDAEKAKVVLAIEDHGGMPGTSPEIIAVLDEIGSEYLKVLVDLGNFLSKGEKPEVAAKALASRAVMTHVKDVKVLPKGSKEGRYCKYGDYNLDSCVVGEGSVKLVECIRILKAGGYDGPLTLEYEAAEPEETGVPKSLAAIRAAMDEALKARR